MTKLQVARYAAFLARRLRPQSIPKYLNIIRLLHLEADLPSPTHDNWILKSLLSGIKREKGADVKKKLPITPRILLQTKTVLDFTNPNHVVFWAICLVGFFSFLRKSNLLPSSMAAFDPKKHLTRSDFQLHRWGLSMRISWSKTIQFNQRSFEVPLPYLPNHPLCPVTAVWAAFRLTPSAPSNGPAFVLPNPSFPPMLYTQFISILRSSLSSIGLNPTHYAGHSLRRGGASWAFQCLLPGEVIKCMGDWRSDAYLQYLEIPLSSKVRHSFTFAGGLPTF